jgi:hypothetical protein
VNIGLAENVGHDKLHRLDANSCLDSYAHRDEGLYELQSKTQIHHLEYLIGWSHYIIILLATG